MSPSNPTHTRVARALAATLAFGVLLVASAPVAAHGEETRLSPGSQARLAEARRATARFHDFGAALQAGYGPGPVIDLQGLACIDKPGEGAMGVHYVNGALLTAQLDERQPQALIYEPQGDNTLRLVGAEYIVFQSAWELARAGNPSLPQRPRLFGQSFHLVGEPNRYGLPAFYALHAWLWQPNPQGVFADWNPNVRCP